MDVNTTSSKKRKVMSGGKIVPRGSPKMVDAIGDQVTKSL